LKFAPAQLSQYYALDTSLPALVGTFDKATAPILTKIAGGHNATYTATESGNIASWLDAEKMARAGGGPGPTDVMAVFSGCMTITDWNAQGVASAFANTGSNQGNCIQCHVNGQGNFIASTDSQRVFDVITQHRAFLGAYFTTDVSDPANPKVAVNTGLFTTASQGRPPLYEHPLFQPDGNQAITKLTNFFNLTMQHQQAGACSPPRLID
jgi:hypothetical protein